jgi:VWFA-related protein
MLYRPPKNVTTGCAGIVLLLSFAGSLSPVFAIRQDCISCGDVTASGDSEARHDPQPDARIGALAVPEADTEALTIRKRVDEVTVFFTASQGHRFVQDLGQENIRVTDDHKQVTRISAFRHQRELPLRLGLVVDTSGSVNPRFRFEQEAAIQFLRQIVRRDLDRAFVMGFANHANVTQDYSDDAERLAAGVTALRNGGGTALFDAVRGACIKLAAEEDREPAARILIVLSDGDDNTSRTTLSQAINLAQSWEVTIYTINTKIDSVVAGNNIWTIKGDRALKQLAEQTGGRTFSQMSAKGVARAFSAIEEEMRNRYVLSYRPSDLQEDGRYRRIQIEAEKSGQRIRVHARKGYYVRLNSAD